MPIEIFMRPEFDLVTQAGAYWMGVVMQEALKRGYIIDDLSSWEATLAQLEGAFTIIRAGDRTLFYGVGHGSERVYTGQHRDPVLALENAGLMQGTIVHLMSCRTGVELGPALIQAVALAYAGYTYDLYVLLGIDTRPEAIYTEAFLAPDITFALAVLEGKTLAAAYQAAVQKTEAWIEYFREGDDPNADLMILCLLSNRDHFLVLDQTGQVSAPAGIGAGALLLLAGVASVALLWSKRNK